MEAHFCTVVIPGGDPRMIDNTNILAELFENGGIALERAPFLKSTPREVPLEGKEGRIKGMLLVAAVAESLQQ